MTIHGWKTKFKEIRKDFGYSENDDYLSAKKLNSLLKKKFSKKQLQNIIEGKNSFYYWCRTIIVKIPNICKKM